MIMPLFKKNIFASLKILIIFTAVMAMYNAIVIYMYNPELASMFESFQEAMPQMMTVMGMSGVQDSLLEFIHTYLYGLILMVFPIIFNIILVQKLLVRYVDTGSMACLLSTPNSRKKVVFTQLISSILSMTVLLILAAFIGWASAEIFFPGELDLKSYLLLNVALIVFHLMLNAIIFSAACIFTEPKYFYLIGAGLPIVFFLLDRLRDMGGKLENLKYITLFTLFPDNAIVNGDGGWLGEILILSGVALVLYAVGVRVFCKKDLPL